jgi:hypothetical protein
LLKVAGRRLGLKCISVSDSAPKWTMRSRSEPAQPKTEEIEMKVTNKFNFEVAEALALQIEGLIKENPEPTQRETYVACMMVIGDVLASIQCRDCRRLNAKTVKEDLPRMIRHALTQPIQHSQQHTH